MSTRSTALRRVVALTALSSLAVLAAACGGNKPTSNATTAAPTTAAGGSTESTAAASTVPPLTNAPTTTNPAVVPQKGGSLTVAIEAESTGYNPTVDAWANAGHNVAKEIFDTLAVFDASGKVVPYLAKSITPNADSSVWTIVLRPNITFHDAEPFDAAAVQTNFEAVKASAKYKDQLSLVQSMKVIDPLTLEVTMSSPWGTFPNVLTGDLGAQAGYMAAPKMLASPDGGRTPIGTGPFKFVEWVPDDHITLARNDNYWQKPAYLDKVTFKPIPDPTSRKAAFDAGDVDLYYDGSTKDISAYLKNPKVNVTIGAASDPDVILMNTQKAPLDDVRVRTALVMAVDMPRIYDFLEANGIKKDMHGPYPDDSFWFVESGYPKYDVAGAKALIDAYVKEKGPVEFKFTGTPSPFLVSYQQLFQAMWADIGVKADIDSHAQADNINKVIAGDFQMITWGGIGGGDPDKDYQNFHSGPLNFSRFSSPTIDAALDKGRALGDPAARKEQYAIVQKEIGAAVPYIWTGSNQQAVMAQKKVQGVADFTLPDGGKGQPVTGGRFYLKDVWLAS